MPRVSEVDSVPWSGIFAPVDGPGSSSTKRLATPVRPTVRTRAVVPRLSGVMSPSLTDSWMLASPSSESLMSSILPTVRPPTSTEPPLTSCPASTKRALIV